MHAAVSQIERVLRKIGAGSIHWYLEAPVSISGRRKTLRREVAIENGYNWTFDLVADPDTHLVEGNGIVITSDSWILDRVKSWMNLRVVVLETVRESYTGVDLSDEGGNRIR